MYAPVEIDFTFDERESDIYDEAEGPRRWVRTYVPEWTEDSAWR